MFLVPPQFNRLRIQLALAVSNGGLTLPSVRPVDSHSCDAGCDTATTDTGNVTRISLEDWDVYQHKAKSLATILTS